MPRVNKDADISRLMAKYGAPAPKRAQPKTKAKLVTTVAPVPVKVESGWLRVHKEFLRWKKTDDYIQWRKLQFAKQNGLCYYCDISLKRIKSNVEHIIPKSKGGTNKKKNLVLACWRCNKEKYVTVLSKKKRNELREKHLSKARAFKEQISFAIELRDRL